MFLESISTALPPYRFTQAECLSALNETPVLGSLKPRSRSLLEKVLGSDTSGIATRNFCSPEIPIVVEFDAQSLNQYFEKEAVKLSVKALEKALASAEIKASELDALFICTCTGYLCPGVTSYVSETLGLKSSTYLQDLVGLGCGAAIPMLRSAQGYLAANPNAKVATVAVEVCSAAFFADDDPGVLISLCLFGDGAAAAIWSKNDNPSKWQIGKFTTVHKPTEREKIRFVNSGGKLKNQLHKSVPIVAAEAVGELFAQRTAEVEGVLAHSGGRDVIDALESKLGLQLQETREVLSECGNMSSPSVLFAVEKAIARETGSKRWWLTAFGAGFAAHACELWR